MSFIPDGSILAAITLLVTGHRSSPKGFRQGIQVITFHPDVPPPNSDSNTKIALRRLQNVPVPLQPAVVNGAT